MAAVSAPELDAAPFLRLGEAELTHVCLFADSRSIAALGATCRSLRAFTRTCDRIWIKNPTSNIGRRFLRRLNQDPPTADSRVAELAAHLDGKMTRLDHLRWAFLDRTEDHSEAREGTAMAAVGGGDTWAIVGGWGEPPFVMRNDIAYLDFGEPQLPWITRIKRDPLELGLQAAAEDAFARRAAALGMTSDTPAKSKGKAKGKCTGKDAGAGSSAAAAGSAGPSPASPTGIAASAALDISHDPRVAAALLHASPALTGENPLPGAGERWRIARIVGGAEAPPMRPRYGHTVIGVGMPRWLAEAADKGVAPVAPPQQPLAAGDHAAVSAGLTAFASSSSSTAAAGAVPALPPALKLVRQASSSGAASSASSKAAAASTAAGAGGSSATWPIAAGCPHPLLDFPPAAAADAASSSNPSGAASSDADSKAQRSASQTGSGSTATSPWSPVEALLVYGGMLRGGYSAPSREIYLVECTSRTLALRDNPKIVREYWQAVARSNRAAGQAATGQVSGDVKEADIEHSNERPMFAGSDSEGSDGDDGEEEDDEEEAADEDDDDDDGASSGSEAADGKGKGKGRGSAAGARAPAAKRRAVGSDEAAAPDAASSTSASAAEAGAAADAEPEAEPERKKASLYNPLRWRVFRQMDVRWRPVKLRGPQLEQRGYHAMTYAPGTGCVYVSGGIAHGESICEYSV